jgi:hypothetical protein
MGVFAAVLMIVATRQGAGVTSDSTQYFAIADGALPAGHFARGYPWLLRIVDARVIAVASFAVLIWAVTMTGGVIASIAVLTTTSLVRVCSLAMSDGPFLALMVPMLWALERRRYPIVVALAWGMILLRHVGVATIPLIAFVVWRRDGWRSAGVWTALAALILPALVGSRELAWHPPMIADWREGGLAIAYLLAPVLWPWWAVAAVPFALALRSLRRIEHPILFPLGTWAACYTVTLVASRALADALIPFDARLLAPLAVPGMIAIGLTLTATVPLALWLTLRGLITLGLIARLSVDGQQLSSVRFRTSPVIPYIKALSATTPVYTNDGGGVGLIVGRPTKPIPDLWSATTLKRSAPSDTIARRFVEATRGAAVIFFKPDNEAVPDLDYVLPESLYVRACRCAPDTTFGTTHVYIR